MMVQVSFLKSTTRFLLWAFLCTCLVFYFQEAYSHSGGTDSSGGHYDRKNGGYHSHRGTPSSPSSGGGIKNKTPLHLGADKGYIEVVRALLKTGADIEAQDINGNTPLYEAAIGGYKEVIEVLTEKGANKEAQDKDGNTPLYVAEQALRKTTDKKIKKRLKEVIAYLKSMGAQ